MSLLTPDFGLLFWMLISFSIVFFVLAKFGFPVIINKVNERKKFIDDSLLSAKKANERLMGIVKEGEDMLRNSREQELKIIKEAHEIKNNIISEARQQASVEASKLISEAKIAIKKEKEKAIAEVNNQIAELSIGIAEKVLKKNLSADRSQLQYVDVLLKEANV